MLLIILFIQWLYDFQTSLELTTQFTLKHDNFRLKLLLYGSQKFCFPRVSSSAACKLQRWVCGGCFQPKIWCKKSRKKDKLLVFFAIKLTACKTFQQSLVVKLSLFFSWFFFFLVHVILKNQNFWRSTIKDQLNVFESALHSGWHIWTVSGSKEQSMSFGSLTVWWKAFGRRKESWTKNTRLRTTVVIDKTAFLWLTNSSFDSQQSLQLPNLNP